MELTETDIKEFQTIIKEDDGIDLNFEEAQEEAQKFIRLMEIVVEPDDLKGGDANVKSECEIKTSASNRGSGRTM